MKHRHEQLLDALQRIVDDNETHVLNEAECKQIARDAIEADVLIAKMDAASNAEVFFFGAKDCPGHYLHGKKTKIDFPDIPWRESIDTGLLRENKTRHAVSAVYQQRDGWTIISFDDFKGDSRGGSNSAFFAHAHLTLDRLIELARRQWPELAGRIPAVERFVCE